MQNNKNINKKILNKLLYSDNTDDGQKMYLNINLLRQLKAHLIENMTEKEKACINLYNLENYLIERAFDPLTEEIYKDCDELVSDTLGYIRVRPDYWIVNSEIYLELVSKIEGYYYDDKHINKDLIAVYNYIYMNNFKKKLSNKCENKDENNNNSLTNDPKYYNFINMIERDSCFDIDYTNKFLFDISIIHLIYKFLVNENENVIKTSKINNIETRIQNFILFFSNVEYAHEIAILWSNEKEKTASLNILKPLGKKYNLRVAKYNEEEAERLYIENQIKILTIEENIMKIRNYEKTQKFFFFFKAE